VAPTAAKRKAKTQAAKAKESAAFRGLLLVSFVVLVSFFAPMVSFGGQHARSNVQQITPQALDRVTHGVRAPGPIARRQQSLLG
jgi:hypothetical protein